MAVLNIGKLELRGVLVSALFCSAAFLSRASLDCERKLGERSFSEYWPGGQFIQTCI